MEFQSEDGKPRKSGHSLAVAWRFAFRGLAAAASQESSVRLLLALGVVAISAAVLLRVSTTELFIVVVISLVVLATELMNSAIETLADAVHPDYNEIVGRAKDISAAAVLVMVVAAGIVGLVIFGPVVLALVA